jgi:hypothetical protein
MQKSAPKGKQPPGPPPRRKRGFEVAGGLLSKPIRSAGEKRGFALTRLLTHWEEIAGPDIAAIAHPVEVKYGREGGLGATLTVLTTGAQAPLLEMQKPKLLERVNTCYGYRAIARIRITQTAATGFAEGQAAFLSAPKPTVPTPPDPRTERVAHDLAAGVGDDGLRSALERLARNVLSKPR